ncbi:MAG: YqaA family protein [Desulfonauticus sp.]|nr:YqaA family protein [Desulfonauticus sp.]
MVKQTFLEKFWNVARSKGALKTLVVVSFTEAIFFPIPPDALLIPMGLAKKDKAFFYATICLLASIIGGIAGYFLGYFFMDSIGMGLVKFYGLQDKYVYLQNLYRQYKVLAVGMAGLTPIPYKLCTLTAGAFKISILSFTLVSFLSRGIRFYAIAALIYWQGDRAREFLEKRFNYVVTLFVVLLILGFVLLKYL